MNSETLEFIIYPDGRVKETVTGIIGASCQEVTGAVETELGVVISQETTSEYYAQENKQSTKLNNQDSFADW
ncbi:MAG: DUF2997 domain-containing protein [Cyanobacteria bacterium P01_F01_bin.143]